MVRNGFKESSVRHVTGGSPQGTKLGNVLFCLTVEGIHEKWNEDAIPTAPSTPIAMATASATSFSVMSPLAAVPTLSLIHI